MLDPMIVQMVAAILFALGLAVVLTKRNIFFVFMGIEMMLNAVNLSFIGFSRTLEGLSATIGQITPLFVIAVAASEACIGLAMLICITRVRNQLDVDAYASLKE